jgi:hypothetical protein
MPRRTVRAVGLLAVLAALAAVPLMRAVAYLTDRPWSLCGVATVSRAVGDALVANGTVPELDDLPPAAAFFDKYIARGMPVVVRGGVFKAMPKLRR